MASRLKNENTQADIRRRNTLFLRKILLLGIVFCFFNLEVFSNDIDLVSLINQYRTEQGLSSLIVEDALNRTAEKYAFELIRVGRLSHSDLDGHRVLNRYGESGGTSTDAGEILGTSSDISLIIDAWKDSPTHNQLLLGEKWLRIGVYIAESDGNKVAVVLFSISQIYSFEQKSLHGNIEIIIEAVEGRELIFPNHINSLDISVDNKSNRQYRIQFPVEELPKLIPVSGDFQGIKKMSDFLYIR